MTSPAEHAATVRVNLHVHETPCDPGTCHVCRSGEALDALVALAARADEPSATFIPRETDEKPSDAMPSPGHKDWRETAEWWESTCKYWKARADELEREARKYMGLYEAAVIDHARLERAEAALRQIADGAESNPAHEVAALARAALGEQP